VSASQKKTTSLSSDWKPNNAARGGGIGDWRKEEPTREVNENRKSLVGGGTEKGKR